MLKSYIKKCLCAMIISCVMVYIPLQVNVESTTSNAFSFAEPHIVKAAESTDTIVVKKLTNKNVTKIHQVLNNGKPINIKVKGNKNQSLKLIKKINERLKKENKQGVVFLYDEVIEGSGYTTYKINKKNAENYKYAIKLIKRLYNNVKSNLSEDVEFYINYLEDEKIDKDNYPDDIVRYKRQLYDTLIENSYYADYLSEEVWERKTRVKKSNGGFDLWEKTWEIETLLFENTYIFEDMVTDFMSFEEFQEHPRIDEIVRQFLIPADEVTRITKTKSSDGTITTYGETISIGEPELAVYNSSNFCDLSDAMKVYVIAKSSFFACSKPEYKDYNPFPDDSIFTINPNYIDYGVKYIYNDRGKSKLQGIKNLYKNEGSGVCDDYANYEIMLWNSLGLECYKATSNEISHAWSVLKVKNSKGKNLWIPFDYGIGPAEGLAVSEKTRDKYLKTEEMRYQLYLKTIKDAPKEKNFIYEDFN